MIPMKGAGLTEGNPFPAQTVDCFPSPPHPLAPLMPVLKNHRTRPVEIAPGVFRKVIHLDGLMTAIIDFTNGPWTEPEPRHTHPHEQSSYVAKGELMVFIGDEEHRLEEGDAFTVPSNVPHTVKILSPEVRLVDSFQPIREDFLK